MDNFVADEDRLRIFVGIPTIGGTVAAAQTKMWLSLGRALALRADFSLAGMIEVDVTPMDKARNILLAHASNAGADWLLMIDSDTWVIDDELTPGEQLLRMIDDADAAGAAVVGAPVWRGSGLNVWKADRRTKELVQLTKPVDGFNGIDAIGGSIMAVDLEAIGDLGFQYPSPIIGEDIGFCNQVRRANKLVYADARVRTAKLEKPAIQMAW